MSNTVDNRVVEMKFDNQQFEQGVRQTIASLDSLKEALKFNTSATNISTLQNAVNGFSLAHISEAVENLQYRFSAMGIVGATVISDLTQKAIGLAERIARISIGQIITGGKGRAQKVANARFQLEGLLDTAEDVQSAFDSASKAVDGTAYGLDAAVSTASQLAASNVQLGEDLDTALRGVAGLAAMTNTDFEYMGNIFATVAGNGRLMGMQLSQISSHGVNAAAVLGKELGKTEEEIRQMTSKGEISFDDFARAMNNAFGDQAQKANETLQGALSNVRSALSRIGEIFYSGIIENKDFIQFINNIRIAINGVKKAMEPLKKPFFTLVSAASKLGSSILSLFDVHGIEEVVERVATAMEVLSGWLFKASDMINQFKQATQLDEAVKKVEDANKALRKLSEENRAIVENILFGANDYGNGQERVDALGEQYKDVQDYINAMYKAGFDWEEADKIFSEMSVENAEKVAEAKKEEKQANEELYSSMAPGIHAFYNLKTIMQGVSKIAKSITKTFNAVKKAFKRVFSYKDISQDVNRLVQVFKNLTELFQITDDRAEKIQRIFQGMFSVVDFLRQVFVSLVEVLSGTLGPVLSWILDLFLSLGAWLGDIITDFNDFVKENETLRKIASKIVDAFNKITSVLSEFFSKFKELPAVQRLRDYFVEFTTTLGDKLLTFLSNAKGAVGEFFGSISESDGSVMEIVLAGINDALNKFMDLSGKAKGKITDVFDWFGEKNKQAEDAGISIEKIKINLEKLKKIGGNLANSKGPMDFLGNLIDGLSEFNGHIEGWVDSIVHVFDGIDVAKLSLIGFAGSITMFASALSYFTFNAGTFARNLALFPTQLNKTLSGVQALLKGTQMYLQNESKAKVIKAYAIAIAVLAGALIALTFVDQEKLKTATKSLATVMAVMTLMVVIITRLEKSSKDVKGFNQRLASFAIIILSLSAAVLILTLALKELSEITWNANSFKALGVLAVMFLGLITLVYVFSSSSFINGFNLGTTSLIICAASMWILVKALKGLTEMNVDGIEDKLEVLIEVLFTIGIVAKLSSGMRFGSAAGVLAVVAAVWLIEMALKKIIKDGVSTEDIEKNLNKIIPVMVALGVVAAVLYAVGKTGQQAKGSVAVILALTVAILGITYSLRKLAVLSMTGHLYSAVFALIAMFAGMVILCKIIGAAEYEFASAGKALLKISAAVGILAAVVYFMGTKLTPKEAFQGVTIVKTLLVLVAALAVITTYAVNVRGDAFYKMAGVIGMLAVIVALLSFIPDTERLLWGAAAMGTVLMAFGAAMYLATTHINEAAVLRLQYMIVAVAVIAASLVGIMITMKYVDIPRIILAVASLALLMGVLGVIVKELADLANANANPAGFNNIVKIILALTAAIAVIGASLAGIIYVADSEDDIKAAGLALGLLLLSLAACFKLIDGINVNPKAAASLLIASLSLFAIAAALSFLARGGFDFKAMMISVMAMGLLLAEVVAALVGLSAVISSGIGAAAVGAAVLAIAITLVVLTASMIGMGGACILLAEALNRLSNVDFKNIKDNLGTLIKLTLIMTGVAAISIVFGVGLIAIGAGLLLIAASAGIIAASIATVSLSIDKLIKTFNTLLTTIERMAKNHKELSIGLNSITRSVVTFIVEIIAAIAKGIVKAAATIAQNAFVIANAVALVIIAIVQAISKASLRIHTAIFNALEDFLKLLIKRLPGILEKIAKIILLIGDFLLSYAGYFGLLGAMIAAKFLLGVMDGLEIYMGVLTDKAVELLISFVAALADAIANNAGLMTNAVKSLINSVVYSILVFLDGMTNGFLSSFEGYSKAMDNLAAEQQNLAEERARLKAEKALEEEGKAVEDEAQKLKEKYLNVDKDIAATRDKDGYVAGYKVGQNTIGGSIDAVEEYGQPFVKKIADLPYKAVDEMLKSGNYVQDETGKFIVSSFMVDDETENAVVQSISDLPSAMTNELVKSGKWTLSDDGKYLVSTMSEGMQSDEAVQELEKGTDSTQNTILDELKQFKQDYVDDGIDKAKGWIGGWTGTIDTDGYKVTDSIKELTGTVPETAADELGINSPSKISAAYGGYWIEGFIIGMENMKASLKDSTQDVLQPVKDAVSNVSDAVAMGDQLGSLSLEPTIRPVVDMSNVYAASSDLGSMFDTTTSFKMAADSQISVNNSNQMQLANQVAALQASVDKLANTDFSHMMDGVNINVNADTTVDGTVLRKTASNYTIRQINKEEMGYMMATGGRY